MDSFTHLVYGGVIAAAIVPAQHRRAALLAGAVLNTLPDLDVIPLAMFADPVAEMTCHRGITHSWLVLPVVAWLIWRIFRGRDGRVAQSPTRWWWAIFACLMAHPFIDSFTVYGTQLFWPLPMRPLMWSSLFIVDPLFTLPWLVAFAIAWFARERIIAQHALLSGILIGTAYVGWSLIAKSIVDTEATHALSTMGLRDAPRFSVPMPASTLLWRVVAMTPTGYVEAERSLVADENPMRFRGYPSNVQALAEARNLTVVRRLTWFNHGFMRAQAVDGHLVVTDLRMGSAPQYFFRFDVARKEKNAWHAAVPKQLPFERDAAGMWKTTWDRIWHEPTYAAVDNSVETPAINASK